MSMRSTMATNGSWAGYAELQSALDGLASAKGTSATRVKAVAAAALVHVKDYKRVVHDMEMFLWKADVEHRLAGLYAMDAVLRNSQTKLGSKDPFGKRFLLHMNNTLAAIKKVPADQQNNVRRVVHDWQTRGLYTPQQIEELGGEEYSINNAEKFSDLVPKQPIRASPTHSDAASKGKLASLLSIIKKQKELKEQGQQPQDQLHSQHQQTSSQPEVYQQAILGAPPSLPLRAPVSPHHPDPRGREEYRHDDRQDSRRSPRSSPRRSRARAEDWQESPRQVKKTRASRWGPPASGAGGETSSGGETRRPPPISTYPPDRGPRGHDYAGGFPPHPHDPRLQPPPHQNTIYGPNSHTRGVYDHEKNNRNNLQPPAQGFRDTLEPSSTPSNVGYGYGHGHRSSSPHKDADLHRFDAGSYPRTSSDRRYEDDRDRDRNRDRNDRSRDRDQDHDRERDQYSSTQPPRNQNTDARDMAPGNSGEVCRKFLAGRCTRGDRCWHLHNQDHGNLPPTRAQQVVMCANFSSGNCRFGDRCHFAHNQEELESGVVPVRRPVSRYVDNSDSRYAPPSRRDENLGTPSTQSRHHYGDTSTAPSLIVNEHYGDKPLSFPGHAAPRNTSDYNPQLPNYINQQQAFPNQGANDMASAFLSAYSSGMLPTQDMGLDASSAAPPSVNGGAHGFGSATSTSPRTTAVTSNVPVGENNTSVTAQKDDEVEPIAATEFTLQYDDED